MGEYMNWGHIVLGAILYTEDANRDSSLQDIYKVVEDGGSDGTLFNPRLLEVEPRWGERQRFQHTIRSTLSNLVKESLAEPTGRGIYRLTVEGRKLAKNV